MKAERSDLVDESAESEITIQPDGRIYAFGITPQLVDLLAMIPTGDETTRRRLEQLRTLAAHAPLAREEPPG